jgi:hypothetical protein
MTTSGEGQSLEASKPTAVLGKLTFAFPDNLVMSMTSHAEDGVKYVTINFVPASGAPPEDNLKN